MSVLSTKNIKWLGLVVSAGIFFYGVGASSLESVTVDLPVRKYEPLSGRCVAFLVGPKLLHCDDENKPEKYRNEVTFPHATYEQLLALHEE